MAGFPCPEVGLKSFAAILVLLAAACTGVGRSPSAPTALMGNWGGQHAGLVLTADGGTIEYDCAHGTLDMAVRPDRKGGFEATGSHVREHGGPARQGEVLPAVPARYVGQVDGDRMVLQVVVGSDTLGPYTLQRGAPPQLFRCL